MGVYLGLFRSTEYDLSRLDHAGNTPALGFGKGTRLHDFNLVAHFAGIGFVVSVENSTALDLFTVERVRYFIKERDFDGLVAGARDHDTL